MTAHSFISSRAAVINYATPDALVITWDRCVGVVWKRETTAEGVEALAHAYREQATRYPSGVYLLTIVEKDAPMPSTEQREAVAVFLRAGSGRTRMSAVVIEGTGFRAAAVRSVVTGLAMLVRLPYPHEIFGSLDQAAKWLGTTPHNDVDPDYTALAVAHARREAESGELKARRK
ncbi:MAG TPA: hypothetical protein VFX59_00435 [Polyangiales bacterium]|nr:hypothetical protein [Polyangiales bacterium]